MSKSSKFQQIITLSISRVRNTLPPQELAAFESQLKALPKTIKELNAEPYLFIFDLLLKRRDTIDYGLAALTSMLEQNYLGYNLYERLTETLGPLIKDYSHPVVKLIYTIKEPHLAFLQLYFDIHAEIALPEDVHKKFKAHGYNWLIRVFGLTKRAVPPFLMNIYSKFYPEEMPKLPQKQAENKSMENYVELIVWSMLSEVEERCGEGRGNRGKKGWCFLCHQPADYYCKDTKVSVCGVNCKKAHLEMLNNQTSLNFQHSQQFKGQIQQLLMSNISRTKSPALSIDFLIAIYLFSDYQPCCQLPHSRVLTLPVIHERIHLLYLSYFQKNNQTCQHIFASALPEEGYASLMAAEYFLTLCQDERILHIYNSYDRTGDMRLLTFILHKIGEDRKSQLIQHLVKTIFQFYSQNSIIITDHQRPLVRAFNHEQQLTPEALTEMFGDNYHEKLVRLVFRNETQINKTKLSALLCQDKSICRIFLKEIVRRKQGAPIDELIRQIFYFINVKVSEQIYNIFVMLAEVYVPEQPFNQSNFFMYAYFVLMIVTQINSDNVTEKPTFNSVLQRVQKFSVDLAQNHASLINSMLQRVSKSPFTQTSRGILSHYQHIQYLPWQNILPEELIITNWQTIYECALNEGLPIVVLYQICTMVSQDPAICQSFLRLMTDKLQQSQRDPFLPTAISNILELQPNSAGNLWKPILQEALSPTSEQSISPELILLTTKRLTPDNLYQFTRALCSYVSIGHLPQLFLSLLQNNRGRIGPISQLFIVNFQKEQNNYLKLQVTKKLALFILNLSNPDEELSVILLQMMRSVPVTAVTEGLLFQVLFFVEWDSMPHPQQFWNVVSHKCLDIKQQSKIVLLQKGMKEAKHCQSYESYLIQKTLNCRDKQLISQEILRNLSKLQPYLGDINKDVLSLFILEDNIPTILDHFQHFTTLNGVYGLLLSSMSKDSQFTTNHPLDFVIDNLNQFLKREEEISILSLDNLPSFLGRTLISLPFAKITEAFKLYVQILDKNCNSTDCMVLLMTITNISILSRQISSLLAQQDPNIYGMKEKQMSQDLFKWLEELFSQLLKMALSFQHNYDSRFAMKKYIRSNKGGLPSTLTTVTLLLTSHFQLHKVNKNMTQGFTFLLTQVEVLLEKQADILKTFSVGKKDGTDKTIIKDANKDALMLGELLIEKAIQTIEVGQKIREEQKGRLRKLLFEVLMQGFFDQPSLSFKSLAGTSIAARSNYLLKLLN